MGLPAVFDLTSSLGPRTDLISGLQLGLGLVGGLQSISQVKLLVRVLRKV